MAKQVRQPRRRSMSARTDPRPVSARSLDRAVLQSVKKLEHELRKLAAVSDKALRHLEAIRLDGVTRHEEQLVRKAVKDGLFADLAALEPVLTASLGSSPGLTPFRSVPVALLIWAST